MSSEYKFELTISLNDQNDTIQNHDAIEKALNILTDNMINVTSRIPRAASVEMLTRRDLDFMV